VSKVDLAGLRLWPFASVRQPAKGRRKKEEERKKERKGKYIFLNNIKILLKIINVGINRVISVLVVTC